MDIDQYQQRRVEFSKHYNVDESAELPIIALGLVGEAGEVAEHIKKFIRDGNLNLDDLKLELGDVAASLVLVAGYFNFTMSEILDANDKKLQSRLERGVLSGKGDHR